MQESRSHQFKADSVGQIGILVKEDPEEISKRWEKMFGIGPWRIVDLTSTNAEGKKVKLFKLALANFRCLDMRAYATASEWCTETS